MTTVQGPSSPSAELAREPLPSCASLLMACLVEGEAGGAPAVELGRREVTAEGSVLAPFRPLRLPVSGLARLRRLAEEAVTRQAWTVVDGRAVLLFAEDGIGALLTYAPEAGLWFSLVHLDRREVVALPLRDAAALGRVLRAAEQQLAERGLAPLDRGAAH